MKTTGSILLCALFAASASASAIGSLSINGAPSKVKRTGKCTATLTGVNSEGGGGPGQTNIDNNNFGFDITGPSGEKSINNALSMDGTGAVKGPQVSKSAYGGTFDTTCYGDWNGGGNSWYSCGCNQVDGAVGKTKIDPGTVTTSTDTCTVVYDC